METYVSSAISFIISPSFDGILGIARFVFIVLSIVMVLLTIWFMTRSNWLKSSYFEDWDEFITFRPHGVRKMTKAWSKITARLETGLESEYKLAVIEGDGILDDVLKKMGYGGESLGERLEKLTPATLPNIEDIKESHQTRTNILHNPDFTLSSDEARKILAVYEKALENLQAF